MEFPSPSKSLLQTRPGDRQQTTFSLAPAIFTTFSALPTEASPVTQEEKITRILRNLDSQHEAVRRKMMAMLEARKDELVRRAEEEIASLGDDHHGDDDDLEERRKERKRVLQNVRVKVKQGSHAEDYEVKPGTRVSDLKPAAPGADSDVQMSGTGPRTAAAIRQELLVALQDLVELGVAELKAYDRHAASTTVMYKQALKRREDRRGSTNTTVVQSPADRNHGGATASGVAGGISRPASEQIQVDGRRMSKGMPIPGVQSNAQNVRTFESVEEASRRESTRKRGSKTF